MSRANDLFRELLEKGLSNMYIKDNSEELLQKYHDPNKDIKPYLLATFGSAWAVVAVKISDQSTKNHSFILRPEPARCDHLRNYYRPQTKFGAR